MSCILFEQVNVGCVPKKVMFITAMHAEMIHDHKGYGFDVENKSFTWRYVRGQELACDLNLLKAFTGIRIAVSLP